MEIYLIVIGRTATGYSAHCPDVLGCAAVGKTVEAVVANMKQALELHFEGMVEDGEEVPLPAPADAIDRNDALLMAAIDVPDALKVEQGYPRSRLVRSEG